MKNLKGILSIFGIIIKYAAVISAIIKGLSVVNDELQKLDKDKTENLSEDE